LQNSVTVLKGVAEVMIQSDESISKAAGDLLEQVKISHEKDGVHINCKWTRQQIQKATRGDK
jgi:hypothetical protein